VCVCVDRSFLYICLSLYLRPSHSLVHIYIYIYIMFAYRKGRRRIRLYRPGRRPSFSSALYRPPLPAHRSPLCDHPERGPSDRLTSREHRTRPITVRRVPRPAGSATTSAPPPTYGTARIDFPPALPRSFQPLVGPS